MTEIEELKSAVDINNYLNRLMPTIEKFLQYRPPGPPKDERKKLEGLLVLLTRLLDHAKKLAKEPGLLRDEKLRRKRVVRIIKNINWKLGKILS